MDRGQDTQLKTMWDAHREYIRCFLVGMTHDSDLADDLLQDTYLRASNGMSGFRGGEPRSWLCSIARNTFLSHRRRPGVRSEVQRDYDEDIPDPWFVGSTAHVTKLQFDHLLSGLPDDLRTAFILKHRMGMSYSEIARRTDCAVVTARGRVHRAVCRIRAACAETWKPADRKCDGMDTNRILDFLFDLLRPESMEAVEDHLRACARCREHVQDARMLIRAMDADGCSGRMMHLVEVGDWGVPSLAVISQGRFKSEEPINAFSFGARRDHGDVLSVAIPGSRLDFDMEPYEGRPDRYRYTAELPEPVTPEKVLRSMSRFGPIGRKRALRTDGDTYRLDWDQMPSEVNTCGYTQVIRLPEGSRLLHSDPAPADVIVNGGTTLVWHSSLMPSERFRSTVEYSMSR